MLDAVGRAPVRAVEEDRRAPYSCNQTILSENFFVPLAGTDFNSSYHPNPTDCHLLLQHTENPAIKI